jgi:hypothetical protein
LVVNIYYPEAIQKQTDDLLELFGGLAESLGITYAKIWSGVDKRIEEVKSPETKCDLREKND